MSFDYLGLVLHFHMLGSKQLGVNPLGKASVDVFPWSPNRETEGEGACNTENRVPDDEPEEGVEEVEDEIHDVHNRQGEDGLVGAQGIAKEAILTVLNLHPDHNSNRVGERNGEVEVGLHKFACEDQQPQGDRTDPVPLIECGITGRECLTGQVLS